VKDEGNVSIIMILHNYVLVFAACDRVSLLQDGVIALDKPTNETSVDELNEIVVEEYRRARLAARAGNGAPAGAGNGAPAGAGNGAPAGPGNGAPAGPGGGAPADPGSAPSAP
jgi:ABC-type multidrug transport system ATPase subunit